MEVFNYNTSFHLMFLFSFVFSTFAKELSVNWEDQNYHSENIASNNDNIKSLRALSYHYSSTKATWLEAFSLCNTLGGLLVTPLNPISDDAVRQYMIQEGIDENDIWTGGRVSLPNEQNLRVWYWETSNIGFFWSNFHSSSCSTVQADYCLSAYTSRETAAWGWCRRRCTESLNYICQFGTPPTTTTTSAPTTGTPGPTTITPGPTTITAGPTTRTPGPSTGTSGPSTGTPGLTVVTPGPTTTAPLITTQKPSTVHTTRETVETTTRLVTTEIPSTTLKTTTNTYFDCPSPNGYFSDPHDCKKYYICEGGHVMTHKTCPGDKLWNNTTKNCDDPWNVDCNLLPTSKTTAKSTTETPSTTEVEVTTTMYNFICPSPDGLFADPDSCSQYYVCKAGVVASHESCPGRLLWNNTIKKCDDPWNVDCE